MKHAPHGYSLVEVLIGATIGLLVLSGLISFFINMSRQIQIGQNQAQVTSRAQQALSRMVQELKAVNTSPPSLVTITESWDVLPMLPYSGVELYPYTNTSGSLGTIPSVPAARKFVSQTGLNDKFHKWYPNPDQDTTESNSLVFYQVIPMASGASPTATRAIARITYRLDSSTPDNPKLIREIQQNIDSTSNSFTSNPTPEPQVIVDQVKSIQFTYPLFAAEMNNNAGFETQLQNMSFAEQNEFLNQSYRNVIAIGLVLSGAVIGTHKAKGIELTTEVKIRN